MCLHCNTHGAQRVCILVRDCPWVCQLSFDQTHRHTLLSCVCLSSSLSECCSVGSCAKQYVCMCVWVYVCICVCVYGCMCVWVYVCMGVCVYGCMCVWV